MITKKPKEKVMSLESRRLVVHNTILAVCEDYGVEWRAVCSALDDRTNGVNAARDVIIYLLRPYISMTDLAGMLGRRSAPCMYKNARRVIENMEKSPGYAKRVEGLRDELGLVA